MPLQSEAATGRLDPSVDPVSASEYVRKILAARVYDIAIETPLEPMPQLSLRLAASVHLKREDLQPVFSFKLRGAYNKMVGLSREVLDRGVICASAGNHAQGVALAAQRLGATATIVMPRTTPDIKVKAVLAMKAEVVLHGDSFDEAYDSARELEVRRNLTFIHPYDDPDVIAGQGTIGMEILRQHPDAIEAIFVPIGGGGLAAGIASYTKFIRPETKVIGVEPTDAASMAAALAQNERVKLDQVGLFADGVAVRQAGVETFRICRELLDEVITVDTDQICAAIKDIFDDTRAISEPAGALGLAGLKRFAERNNCRGGSLVAINSGANLNFDRLRHIGERAQIGERREALFAVTIPERKGSYLAFVQTLGHRSITEFNYRYAGAKSGSAQIFVGIGLTHGDEEKAQIIQRLKDAAYSIVDLTDNEMAKSHVRYMVGGRAPDLAGELIYRFQFPERPGALLKFLSRLGQNWNISLFHYRSHGADYGRVLAGIQVPKMDREYFEQSLNALGYPYWNETENPSYRFFLANDCW